MTMARLRHIAMAVPDVEKTARFYEEVFGMTLVQRVPSGSILLTDGVISLALLDNNKLAAVKGVHGLHHVGFVVDDLDATRDRIESTGGVYADDTERLTTREKRREAESDDTKRVLRQKQLKF